MFKYASIVFKKEIKDTFRDKKTIFMQFFIPIILFPLVSFIMSIAMSNVQKNYDAISEITIQANGNRDIENFMKKQSDLVKIINSSNVKKDLKEDKIKAIVKVDKDFEKNLNEGKKGKVIVEYLPSSLKSQSAEQKVKNIIENYSKNLVSKKIESIGVSKEMLEPVQIESKIAKVDDSDEKGEGILMIAMIIPMILSIYAATSPMPYATDLGVGEKERQTLEPLITTRASRMSILTGKYGAILFFSIISIISIFVGMFIAYIVYGRNFGAETMSFNINISTVVISIFLFLGLSLIFSSLELAMSFYARNFKEAQIYNTPIMILTIIPAYFSIGIDALSIPFKYFNIPILNVIVLFKEIVYGKIVPMHIITVFIWLIIYISLSLFLTSKMFKSEKVTFRN